MQVFYHGTQEDRATSILRRGLLTGREASNIGFPIKWDGIAGILDHCYLASTVELAIWFGKARASLASRPHYRGVALLQVSLPDNFTVVEADPSIPNDKAYRVKGSIPPQFIKKVVYRKNCEGEYVVEGHTAPEPHEGGFSHAEVFY